MDEIAKTRLKVFIGLAVIVIIVHVILIRVFVMSGSGGNPEKKPAPETPQQTEQGAKEPEKKAPAPVVKTRFFRASANPRFGAPLDYATAVHGDIPATVVPGGSKGARSGIIVDMDTRRVIWEKNSRKPVPIASMAKMMTMLLVMEEMEKRPAVDINTPITVTQTARNVPRTGVLFLAPGEKFTVQELMVATAVKSANDAATLLAEYFGGSVPAFIARMNQRAAELDLKSLQFFSPCGLADGQNRNAVGSAADMVLLGEQLFQYPLLIQWCNIKSASIRNGKTVFVNTNHLVNPRYPGVDGLKTGFLRAAGTCLTFSCLRDSRRIMGCVTGFKTARDRDFFCRRLLDWAYKQPGTATRPPVLVPDPALKPAAKSAAKPAAKAPVRKTAPAQKKR